MPRRPPPSPLRLCNGPLPPRGAPRHKLPDLPRPIFIPTCNRPPGSVPSANPIQVPLASAPSSREERSYHGHWSAFGGGVIVDIAPPPRAVHNPVAIWGFQAVIGSQFQYSPLILPTQL
ncbi:hypothetical protein BS47DRAFT_1490222 [Hydnum rufescens UP504]|uniref:Uncharacterized protein n=1 Tax=Hydnum rufescens UP504 TaxID=1448309 RepID=A0A9P6DMI3_9AGAM|nr:hypothetical protein BS47DRAFT_1490222 [Hydnum rufescens UP504]